MGDDDGRPADHQPFQCLLNQQLGLGVDGRGRLVEDQNGCILQHGPRDGESLPLAAGELHAPLADQRVISLGKLLDELLGVGDPRRLDHLAIGRSGAAEPDILADGAVEQEDILKNDADLSAEALQREVAQVDAVRA